VSLKKLLWLHYKAVKVAPQWPRKAAHPVWVLVVGLIYHPEYLKADPHRECLEDC
jgi:hypothetical protein